MAGGRQDGQGKDSEVVWILAFIVIGVVAFGLWHVAREYIVWASFGLQWILIKIYAAIFGLRETGAAYLDFIESMFDQRRDASVIYWSEFVDVSSVVGGVTAPYLAAIIGGLGVFAMFKMRGEGFRRPFKLVPLIHYQSEYWKTLKPSAVFNPDKPTENMMPAKNPVEFLHSLKVKARLTDSDSLSPESSEIVLKAFEKQLGIAWKPVPKLPLHIRCLLALMAAHAHSGKDEARTLREDIAVIFATVSDKQKRASQLEKLIAPILSNEKAMAPIVELAEKHAYASTALISVLKYVREEKGVLPSAEFLWLKEVDRSLWYVMNDVGRRTYHVESAGVYAHYFHENVLNRPVIEPKVSNAVAGLEKYLEEQAISEPL